MKSKNEFIGLTYDDEFLRIAKVRLNSKKKPILVSTQTIELTKPLDSTETTEFETLDSADEQNIFDLESASGTTETSQEQDDFDVLTNFSDLDEEQPESETQDEQDMNDDDPFNLEAEVSEESSSVETRSNELLLTEYFEQCSAKKLITGLHIPFGKTSFQLLKGVDPSAMKKRDRHDFFAEKLRPVYVSEIEKDQYSWVQLESTKSILAYTQDSYELISLAESVQEYTDKKVILRERLPDESIWAGLLRYNYDVSEDQITGFIAIGKSRSRVVFMKGKQILSILPIITEGEESTVVLNTIYSKILFELDKGELPGIDRLLLVQSDTMGEMAKVYFQRQFENSEVDFLTLNQDKVELSDPGRQSPSHLQPYNSAIGAAFAAANVDPEQFSDFSLLPNYIKEKQHLYKIEWHGALILFLIGLTPLFLNFIYEINSNELNQLQNDIALTEIQIESLRPLADLTENIQQQTNQLKQENEYLLDLAQYSHEWSDVMQILNSGTADLSGLWFTSIQNNSSNLSMTGFSMTREALPRMAELFTEVNIMNVNESEIRDQRVYNFSMVVNNFRQDIPSFSPELPLPETRFLDVEDTSDIDINTTDQEQMQTAQVQPQTEQMQAQTEQVQPEQSSPVENETTTPSEPEVELTENVSEPESGGTIYGLRVLHADTVPGSFAIVIHSLQSEQNAHSERERLINMGYKSVVWQVELESGLTTWRVGIGQFETVVDALNSVGSLPSDIQEDYFISRIL